MYLLRLGMCLWLQISLAGVGVWATEEEAYTVGGSNSQMGQFPFMVSVQLNGQHICGASILQFDKLLTAAHCVDKIDQGSLTVVAGIVNLQQTDRQTSTVYQIIMHPEYNRNSLQNDIAILRLNTDFVETPNVHKIFLQPAMVRPYADILTIIGWSETSYPNGPISDDLKSIQVRPVSFVECDVRISRTGKPVTIRNVCTASQSGTGTCLGDSGGPVIDRSGRQVGVISWGYPCAQGYPDVHSAIAYFYVWLNDN